LDHLQADLNIPSCVFQHAYFRSILQSAFLHSHRPVSVKGEAACGRQDRQTHSPAARDSWSFTWSVGPFGFLSGLLLGDYFFIS